MTCSTRLRNSSRSALNKRQPPDPSLPATSAKALPAAGPFSLPSPPLEFAQVRATPSVSPFDRERILGYGLLCQSPAQFQSRPYRTADQYPPARTPRKTAHQSPFRGPLAFPPRL